MSARSTTALVVLLGLALLSACGNSRPGYLDAPQGSGATGRAGGIVVSNALFAFSGPVDSPVAYRTGESAPVVASVINTGDTEDRLVSVSSPIAGDAQIIGDTTLPRGHVIAIGSQPGTALPDTTSAQVVLTSLRQELRPGMAYPVVFTFARAGDLRMQVPIATPDEVARTCEPTTAGYPTRVLTAPGGAPVPGTPTAAPGC